MKVVATREGFYDNILRDPGEVFELLMNDDGSMPIAEQFIAKIDPATGKPAADGSGDYITIVDKDGTAIHRDYAPDQGDVAIRFGPRRGDMMPMGWMLEVPEDTEVGIYPVGTRFGARSVHAPVQRKTPQIERIHAPVKGSTNRPRMG